MVKFPELEEKILDFWKKNNIFQKSLAKDAPQGRFVFFEGPPTANGQPGIHHVLARAFKDLIPRYKTMRGYRVERKAGWDTQGLPVELQVEKELKFKGKPDIEKYGVKEFNERCKKDVWKFKGDWERLTERIGFWLDLEHPYVTYENYYIESLWWIFKKVWEAGLLYQDYKVLPHCPRCGTALSSHEVALGYKNIKESSVYIKFKVVPGQKIGDFVTNHKTYILSWTTTPWTLPGNVALAVGKDIEYEIWKQNGESLIIASARRPVVCEAGLPEGKKPFKGKVLVNLKYQPLYDIKPLQNKNSHQIYSADFVTTADGTGIVHTAVMYGEDDFILGTEVGLPKHHTVDESGKFTSDVSQWAGKFVKDIEVERGMVADLQERGLLLKEEIYTHDYPFCWRCSTPLLYYAKRSWFIKMSALREDMKKANQKINWYPGHIKKGRFGEWLEGAKDWAISRERYWGTPLPIWICSNKDCGHQLVVESLKELAETSGQERVARNDFDIHRPYVDEIKWPCKKCGSGEMKRVPEVADCWFDSGSMPFAQWGYPHLATSSSQLATSYPADYISEAIDQTRGWFYTLLAVATLLKKAKAIKDIPPYKNVICLGHINDKYGQKMSKSKGNIIDPWEIINKYGADALRWHFYTMNQPGEPKNFDPQAVEEVVKKNLLILMNVLVFYQLHQDHAEAPEHAPKTENILDEWVLSLQQKLVNEVTEHLDKYEITEAGRKISEFNTELSQWYVRRSRDRFKESGLDQGRARTTLGFVLRRLAILLAPFTPFMAEELYSRVKGGKESVHLENWPTGGKFDAKILHEMKKAREVVELALAERAKAGIKVRQPLRKLETAVNFTDNLRSIIADEVNVHEVVDGKATKLDTIIDAELKAQGLVREFIRQVNAFRKKQGLTIQDKVLLKAGTDQSTVTILAQHREAILKGALAKDLILTADASYKEKITLDSVEITFEI